MPNLGSVTLPADAFEKSEAKAATVDYYAGLSAEERAEEGIEAPAKPEAPEKSAAEPEKPAPAEPEKPAPEKPAEPAKPEVEDDEDEEAEVDPALSALLQDVAALREDVAAAIGSPEREKKTPKEDPLIEAAKEHEDPVIREMAVRLEAAEKGLAEAKNERRAERIEAQLESLNKEFDAVQKSYVIEGKPMTDAQIEAVEDFMEKNPAVAKALSVEQVTRVVHPGAARVGKQEPPKPPAIKPGKAAGGDPPTATIVDTGSSGGATAGPTERKPYKDIESAVKAAGKALSLTR